MGLVWAFLLMMITELLRFAAIPDVNELRHAN
jgi:hypothetical protein